MTLYEIVKSLQEIAQKQPNINYVGEGDIYILNSKTNIDYSVFFITQTNHAQYENTIEYNLTLFYVDRLMTDESNRLKIQSEGIMMLGNIINIFNQKYPDVEIEYTINHTTFLHKFADSCAGVFANVKIIADNNIGVCGYE